METVTFIRRLKPYSIHQGTHHIDPFVNEYVSTIFDEELKEKLSDYTRGMYSHDLHYQSFEHFRRPISDDATASAQLRDDPLLQQAITQVILDFQDVGKVSPLRQSAFHKVEYQGSAAAGYGYHGKKRDNFRLARRNALRALRGYKRHEKNYRFVPDKAFARTQLATKLNPKLRHVWGRAFHHILIEGLFACPLYSALKRCNTPVFVGRDIHKDMPSQILSLLANKEYLYCLDFSKFDASLSSYLIETSWDVLRTLFTFRDAQDSLAFDFCRTLFMNNPIVMPDGKLYVVTAGLPSGSYFTQIIGSISNLLLIRLQQSHFLGFFPRTFVLGDDSIYAVPSAYASINDLANFYKAYGLNLNMEKTIITNVYPSVHFLGHNFYGARVSRDDFNLLQLALYPEEEVSTADQALVRVASLLLDSGFNSTLAYHMYNWLLNRYPVDWSQCQNVPISLVRPYRRLFSLA